MQKLLFFLFIVISSIGSGQDARIVEIHNTWLSEAQNLTKNCVGFSAPVTGRAFAYFSIGMYESSQPFYSDWKKLSNKIVDFKPIEIDDSQEYNQMLVANTCDYEMIRFLYRGMSVKQAQKIDLKYQTLTKKQSKKCKKKVNQKSIELGREIAKNIIEFSKKDGAFEAYLKNFPENYTPPKCDSCWTRTNPGYLPALTPFWGKNKLLIENTDIVVDDCQVLPYSDDSTSFLYKEAKMVWENGRDSDAKYELIAEYWDDGAGHTGTPSGHFFSIAQQLAIQEKLNLKETVELYFVLGISLNEAFIQSFRLKYKYNFIRPITYIHKNMDPNFHSRIASPPFPEFPSGHSFQAGTASKVLNHFFPEIKQFSDSTHANRTDVDGSPRNFNSFDQMAEEVSISRFYGGIHFKETLDISLNFGQKIGMHVINELLMK